MKNSIAILFVMTPIFLAATADANQLELRPFFDADRLESFCSTTNLQFARQIMSFKSQFESSADPEFLENVARKTIYRSAFQVYGHLKLLGTTADLVLQEESLGIITAQQRTNCEEIYNLTYDLLKDWPLMNPSSPIECATLKVGLQTKIAFAANHIVTIDGKLRLLPDADQKIRMLRLREDFVRLMDRTNFEIWRLNRSPVCKK